MLDADFKKYLADAYLTLVPLGRLIRRPFVADTVFPEELQMSESQKKASIDSMNASLQAQKDRIKDEALKRLVDAEISPEEKRKQMYAYVLDLLVQYREHMKGREMVFIDHCSSLFFLIEKLSLLKNEETYEITEKIFDVMKTTYA